MVFDKKNIFSQLSFFFGQHAFRSIRGLPKIGDTFYANIGHTVGSNKLRHRCGCSAPRGTDAINLFMPHFVHEKEN